MSIMSDEIVFKAGAGVFTNRNSRTRILCDLRRLDDRFTRAGNLDRSVLHTAYSQARNADVGVRNTNTHSPWAGDVETGKKRVLNILSENRHTWRKDPGAVERRADHRNAAP